MITKKTNPEEVITEVADLLSCGMVCFINPETLEFDFIPKNLYEEYGHYGEDEYNDIIQEMNDTIESWEKCIRIDPPESWESFKIMENFIDCCIPDSNRIKDRLINAISRKSPFRNFSFVIDNSTYRKKWYDFRVLQLEKYVLEQLSEQDKRIMKLKDAL